MLYHDVVEIWKSLTLFYDYCHLLLKQQNKFTTLRGSIAKRLQLADFESSLISWQSDTEFVEYTQHIAHLIIVNTDRVSVEVLHPAGEVGRLPDHHTHVPVDLQEAGLVVNHLADNDNVGKIS